MRLSTIVNRLLAEGSIERVRVNWYRVLNTARTRQLNIPEGTLLHPLTAVHEEFAVQISDEEYVYRATPRPERMPRQDAPRPVEPPCFKNYKARRLPLPW